MLQWGPSHISQTCVKCTEEPSVPCCASSKTSFLGQLLQINQNRRMGSRTQSLRNLACWCVACSESDSFQAASCFPELWKQVSYCLLLLRRAALGEGRWCR